MVIMKKLKNMPLKKFLCYLLLETVIHKFATIYKDCATVRAAAVKFGMHCPQGSPGLSARS